MAIKKQEFYEGAALHLLARSGKIRRIQIKSPFFLINETIVLDLKYSTKSRSPWSFTFLSEEQMLLREESFKSRVIIGLICGSDGIAAISYKDFISIAATWEKAVHIACYRKHGQHYDISGPDGRLPYKVAPSNWTKIIHD